jgi:release factor glutamine methyltransferase
VGAFTSPQPAGHHEHPEVQSHEPRAQELALFRRLVERRVAREPLAYIVGERGFRRLRLAIDRRAFIPRPGTEVVVERRLALLRDLDEPRILDIGTGSGAIALPSPTSIDGARDRCRALSRSARSRSRERRPHRPCRAGRARRGRPLHRARGPVRPRRLQSPYLPAAALDGLEPETRLYEPPTALVAERLNSLIACAGRDVIAPKGSLVLECGGGQGETLVRELRSLGYESVVATADGSGRDRVMEGTRAECRALAA